MSIVAIVGSRNLSEDAWERVYARVQQLPATDNVVTGDADGADDAARAAALNVRMLIVVRPAWQREGKAAGPIRNRTIVAICDRMVAFWDGESRGTKSAIEAAQALGKPVEVVRV